ncbi:MAG TPA: SDR family oxidoreductase [Streptosporangiaceae bacterium]|nr:SDR family oxidoreductase [Streptosporangiaceae bacterium]
MTPATGVALVTGAGSGLGRGIARALLTAGWKVAVAGRREAPLRETIAGRPTPSWPPDAALAVPADVSDPESVAALFGAVTQRWERLDLLVNNAGTVGQMGSVDEISLAQWQQIVDVNLTGAFLCAHHAVRIMKTQDPPGGRIINNGSISAHTPRPRSVGYTATKHAMTGLTKSIALDGRRFNIACGQIDIGNAATEITEIISKGILQADGSVLAEPTFDALHVADAVLYMASLPLDANVQFLTITATRMPYIGRG